MNNQILHMQSYKNQAMKQNRNFEAFYRMQLTPGPILFLEFTSRVTAQNSKFAVDAVASYSRADFQGDSQII